MAVVLAYWKGMLVGIGGTSRRRQGNKSVWDTVKGKAREWRRGLVIGIAPPPGPW